MADKRQATPEEVEAVRKAQAAEYGTYVAIAPIDIDGARAFNVGDPVPNGHVEGQKQGHFDDETGKVTYTDIPPVVPLESVARRTTKAAKQAVTASKES